MKKILPVVILQGDVIFPGTIKSFFVKPQKGKELFDFIHENHEGKMFVMFKESNDDPNFYEDSSGIGTICRIKNIQHYKDEMFRVLLEGQKRALLVKEEKNEFKKKFVIHAEVAAIKEKSFLFSDVKDKLKDFLTKNAISAPTLVEKLDDIWNEKNQKDIVRFIYRLSEDFSLLLPNPFEFKMKILEADDAGTRLQFFLRSLFLEDKSWQRLIDSNIEKKISKNVSKQQREFYLREKIKVIREEMGEYSPKETEALNLKKKVESGNFPQNIKEKILDEIKKFEVCSPYSSESGVLRSYIDWLISLPWLDETVQEYDFEKIQKDLNESHYGLEKIKDRILEFIAVSNKTKKNQGTVLCFIGPPGVGKTSLAISIAAALNRKFVKISLGGVSDESEIRGHRRTYVASMPGKIIRALKTVKVKNPVILLDEIDKIGVGYGGDPASALLEVLDPSQNEKFHDNYIEEDFDLSKVMFIATANYDENIPDALYDRMEIVYLRSYTEKEKLNIAKSNLIKEVLKEHGLTSNELEFTDEAVSYIISKYTREAGVRSLKKNLSKIARKFVKKQMLGGIVSQKITEKDLYEYLEYEKFDYTKIDENPIPGVVNGMAYTETGGDLLPIEINHMPGKGNISLTGNLKDTMRESASVALAYVRANEKDFGLKDKQIDWNNLDINLHVPSGGVPKDGPSAGVTITTALISSLNDTAVSSNIAMTGEITLRGKVLPIGGLKEKVISSVRGGVDTIFFPKENVKNLIDIPEDIREKVTLIPVEYYQEIYKNIFKSSSRKVANKKA